MSYTNHEINKTNYKPETQREMKMMNKEEYIKFMYNENNIMNCENCPENNGFDSWQNRKPCGQFHCWVAIHTQNNNDDEK